MCNFIAEGEIECGNKEYITRVTIDGKFYLFTFDAVLKRSTVEITHPPKEELHELLTPDCIEQLKKILWNRIRLHEVTGNGCK